MQAIRNSVGDSGTNERSDSALVQAILAKIIRAAAPGRPAGPYLTKIDGDVGSKTNNAIRDFQNEYVFVNEATQQSVANPLATPGLVRPGDPTWAKMLEKVDAAFSDMRVLIGGKTVYVAATENQRQAKINAVNALTFTQVFRTRVINCITQMHSLHGIAIGVCPQGDRRTFQTQYDLLTSGRGVTNAGPGESNHNFGMAADLGFAGLRWLRENGTVVENEDPWLHQLDPRQTLAPEALRFWETLRTVGTSPAVGAFRGPVADRPHLQNWNDANVSMTRRLAVHLTNSGTMRWERQRSRYTCDLGFGGALFEVGTAAQIWNREATITAEMIRTGRAAQAATRPMQGGQQARPAAAPVTEQDVRDMRTELRRQFDLADANWENWTAN
ncbi:MAG TPA: hypothetical protein PLR83_08805 [Pyrinomonadaceae bacterium]|nr:hypothetical protein [Pyrinomonadaceae bacterium]